MPKRAVKISPEELKEMIQLESGSQAAEVAEGVFAKLFEDYKGQMDGKISSLIYGGIIATALVLVSLCFSTWLFMSSYQQNFLETQNKFNEQMNTLTKENAESQAEYKIEIERLKEKQSYLERLLLDKTK